MSIFDVRLSDWGLFGVLASLGGIQHAKRLFGRAEGRRTRLAKATARRRSRDAMAKTSRRKNRSR